jgi:hypothetical protein
MGLGTHHPLRGLNRCHLLPLWQNFSITKLRSARNQIKVSTETFFIKLIFVIKLSYFITKIHTS